jgi:hypothetical protein
MSSKIEVSRYHVQLFKLAGDQQKYAHGALGAVEVVRASDFDRVTAERDALLAAPVLERQPVAFIQIPKNVEKYGHGDQADRLSFGKPGQFFVNGESPMFDFVLLYTAPPELAELQATIANQAAEIDRLNARLEAAGDQQ